MRFLKRFRIKFKNLRYLYKNRFFEAIKTIIFNLLRYLARYYKSGDEGTTIFTLGMITGIDVDILETIVSDLIIEKKVYECNLYEYRKKVSSFYLRDLITIFSLDKYLLKDDYVFLMPIDTQVKKFALKTRIITNEKEKDANIRQKIVDYCIKFKVNPLRFNQGAWFLGAHCFDILLENLEKF